MNLKHNSVKLKVAFDLFYTQMSWTLWYVSIMLVLHFVSNFFLSSMDLAEFSLASTIFDSSRIYVLIIGIITCFSFMSYYVKNGVTRKDYFIGSTIATIGISISIIVIVIVVNEILRFFGLSMSLAEIIPNTDSIWLFPIVGSLNLISNYIAGWLIAVGFSRFGVVGILSIPISILIIVLTDLLWGSSIIDSLNFLNISFAEVSIIVSMISTLVIIGIGLLLIRLVTKNIVIDPD